MENTEKYAHIKGWGVDTDPKNDPTYPMKNYTGDDHNRLNYEKPPQQEMNVEILHSNERPGVSAVFGTSAPPSGWSGAIRRYAFNYSESSFGHWLPLFFADRINVIEAIVDDIKNGHFPNIFKEAGGAAAWKYNRKGVIRKALTGAVILGIVYTFFCRSGKKKRKRLK
jgi:hypothetical protein